MTNYTTLQRLYDSWVSADTTWMAAIERAYPKHWPGDVRYTPKGLGAEGTALRAAHDTFVAARDAFHAAGGAQWLAGDRYSMRDKLREEIAISGDC